MKRTYLLALALMAFASQASAAPNLKCTPFWMDEAFIEFDFDAPGSIDGSVSYTQDREKFYTLASCEGDVIELGKVAENSVEFRCGSVDGDAVKVTIRKDDEERWWADLYVPAKTILGYPGSRSFSLVCNEAN